MASSTGCRSSGAARRRRATRAARRCRCTCTACRATPTNGRSSCARSGGLALDLPGFGRSGKPGSLSYTIDEYDRFIERFLDELDVDAGAARDARLGRRRARVRPAPARARRARGDRQRGARSCRLPLAPHRAHLAHAWPRRAGDGDHDPLHPAPRLARVQRARRADAGAVARQRARALRPGHRSVRSCACTAARPPRCSRRRARASGRSRCPRWSCGACATRTSRPASGASTRSALPNAELLELPDAGHWPWLDRPDVVDRVVELPERRVSAGVPAPGAARPNPEAGSSPPASIDAPRLPPAWTITAVLAVVYLILAPQSPDLAAASYRSNLFSQRRLHAVGQLLVRRAPPARLLAARAGARAR